MSKPTILSNGLILVKVAPDATNFRIGDGHDGVMKSDLFYDTKLNAWNLGNVILESSCEIIGWITKDECSFCCSEYVLKSLNKFGTVVLYNDYTDILNEFLNPFDSFKSMIEAETDFRFEKPYILYDKLYDKELSFLDQINDADKKAKEVNGRVVEKLVVLKEVKP